MELREQIAAKLHLMFYQPGREHPSWDDDMKQIELERADAILALMSTPASLDECRLTIPEMKDCLKRNPNDGAIELVNTQLHSPKLSAYIAAEKEKARKEVVEWMENNSSNSKVRTICWIDSLGL